VDVYSTEEQQIEAIKKWWQTNGNSVLIGIVLAIAAVFGYHSWTQSQQENSEAAAVLYGQVIEAATAADQNRMQGNTEELEGQLATLTAGNTWQLATELGKLRDAVLDQGEDTQKIHRVSSGSDRRGW